MWRAIAGAETRRAEDVPLRAKRCAPERGHRPERAPLRAGGCAEYRDGY